MQNNHIRGKLDVTVLILLFLKRKQDPWISKYILLIAWLKWE